MKFLPYLLKHLRRNWFRTALTVLAMALCIFLFCTLQSVLAQINGLLEGTSARRLVTRHAVSIVFNLPLAYGNRIAGVPGVKRVATVAWFGGSLPAKKEEKKTEESTTTDFSNFFPNLAVEPEPFLAMYPEYQLPPDQYQAFLQDLRGCVIGRKLADRFGWKVGDTFYLESFIPPYRKSDGPFEFVVKGIFDSRPREVPRHRHEPDALQLQVPVRGDRPSARRGALTTRDRRPGATPAPSARRSTRCSRTRTPRRAPRPRRPSPPASSPWPATWRCC